MKTLKDRILKDGKCYPGGILKVDNFINHQMDPILMKSIGVEFVRRFASTSINKIITVEASGIAPAIMVGYLLELPVVFAKKKKPSTMENMLVTSVYSFTKHHFFKVLLSAFGGLLLFTGCPLAVALCRVAVTPETSLSLCKIGFFGRMALTAV